MAANLVLIASYPKSGNTWTRLVMQGLLDPQRAGAINGIEIGLYGSNRRRAFDELAPALASDLLPKEIDLLLPSVYEEISSRSKELIFLKVHDRAYRNTASEWIFPAQIVRAVLHLVRHPFDVAVSFAQHLGCPVDRVIDIMSDSSFGLSDSPHDLALPMREVLGSWSEHAASWLDQHPYPVITARYEDLYRDDLSAFRKLAEAIPFSHDCIDQRLEQAVTAARFDRVQSLEQHRGFREKPRSMANFFAAGSPMRWPNHLAPTQRDRLARDHSLMMERFGYGVDGQTLPPSAGLSVYGIARIPVDSPL